MEEIGQPGRARVTALAVPFAPALAALVVSALTSLLVWPFAIDDAWIGVRYARHLAAGAGYVWNVGGASTDGVTPLPWALMVAPLAHAAPLVVLARVKLAGAIVSSMTAFAWGAAMRRAQSPAWAKWSALVILAVDLPVAAHAVSGMETAFAAALATVATVLHRRPLIAASLAGLAATLRPELVVWSVALALGFAWLDTVERAASLPGRLLAAGAVASLPFVLCALVRGLAFDHLAPLSVTAKPSDLAHGFAYAGAAAIFSLAPLLLLAPVTLLRERGPALVVAVAAMAHVAVVVAVGGDWMPYARLVAPIVPSMLLAFVWLAPRGPARFHVARVATALGVAVWLVPANVRALRQAGDDRSAMIEAARRLIAPGSRVAAVDIGWVSAVTEGTIVDLAGLTDPEVTALGGGHTSKRVDASFLLARTPDLAIFYAAPLPPTLDAITPEAFPRVVEARLARAPLFAEHFSPEALLPLGSSAGYVLYRRR